MYLKESPRRGDSNKYPKRMFCLRVACDWQWKNTRFADFCVDRLDVITKFAVITDVVIKRGHCNYLPLCAKFEWT